MQRYKIVMTYFLSEITTGSSPVISTDWSLQSSSHVFAYPSSNRRSRFWRIVTVVMRSTRTTPDQYLEAQWRVEWGLSLTKHHQRPSDIVCRDCRTKRKASKVQLDRKRRDLPQENGIKAAGLWIKSACGIEIGISIIPWEISHRSGQNSSVNGLKFRGSRWIMKGWIDTAVPSGK